MKPEPSLTPSLPDSFKEHVAQTCCGHPAHTSGGTGHRDRTDGGRTRIKVWVRGLKHAMGSHCKTPWRLNTFHNLIAPTGPCQGLDLRDCCIPPDWSQVDPSALVAYNAQPPWWQEASRPFWKDAGHLLPLAPRMTCHHETQMHRTAYGGPPARSGVPPGSPQSQSQETYRQPGAWQTLQTQPLVLGAAQAPTVPGGVPPPCETACKPQHQHCWETVSSCWEQKASCLPWRRRSIPRHLKAGLAEQGGIPHPPSPLPGMGRARGVYFLSWRPDRSRRV